MLTVRIPPSFRAEREYTIRVLLEEFLGLEIEFLVEPRAGVEIGDGERRLVVADGLFAGDERLWLTRSTLPQLPLQFLSLEASPFVDHPERDVPLLFGAPSWQQRGDELRLDADIFGGAFFLLSRYEELVVQAVDEHERFPAAENTLVRAGLHRRPLVNEYLELLWLALKAQWPGLTRRPRASEVVPSHDVDWPLAADRTVAGVVRRMGADTLVHREPLTALRRAVGYAGRVVGANRLDVNNTFDTIMDASERAGVRSRFYFIADRRAGAIDGDYSLDDPWIRALLRRIAARGHEIGLHASYTTFLDAEQTRRERDRLVRALDEEGIVQERLGSRQHFLRWRNPQTWRNCDEAALDYDTTVGFADEIGFRAGVCLEYPVFDLERRRQLRLREQPLVAMEGPALDRLGLSHGDALDAIHELRRTCERYHGAFTLLWHNSRLVHRAERRLYSAALSGSKRGSVRRTIDSQE